MNKPKHIFLILVLFLVPFLTACSRKEPVVNIGRNNGINPSPYPPPTQNPERVSPYPSPVTNSENNTPYPPIDLLNEDNTSPNGYPKSGPKFDINEPVFAGSVQVTGSGPANVPIILIDVTEMGLVLAETTINSNGEFTFDLQTPLTATHAVGLQIGDLSNTDLNYDDFMYGENYFDRPLIGILLDMASVIAK